MRSFNGRVKTNRLEWIWTSPRFPAAMPIFISRVIVPWSVSKIECYGHDLECWTVGLLEPEVRVWSCQLHEVHGGEEPRLDVVSDDGGSIFLGCEPLLGICSSHWCHQNFMMDSSAVAVSDAMGIIWIRS